jgi:hypothetical protein
MFVRAYRHLAVLFRGQHACLMAAGMSEIHVGAVGQR